MIPIDPGEDYGELRVYGTGQLEYLPLPCRVDAERASVTKWQLSENERRAILDGAKVGLRILTFGYALQPVYLWIEGTEGDPYRLLPAEISQE